MTKFLKRFGVLAVLLAICFASSASLLRTPAHHATVSPHAGATAVPASGEAAAVGGTACEFGGGLSVGLGIAGLFGCVACGVGSVVVGAIVFVAC